MDAPTLPMPFERQDRNLDRLRGGGLVPSRERAIRSGLSRGIAALDADDAGSRRAVARVIGATRRGHPVVEADAP